MLITGLPYDPTYYGKNTFLVFPMYATDYNTQGTVTPDTLNWFGAIYLIAKDYDNEGTVTEADGTWFGPLRVTAKDYNTAGTTERLGTLVYQDRASNTVISDTQTEKFEYKQGVAVKGTRLQRKITLGAKPNFAHIEDFELSFDVFPVLPVAPYADTEDAQGQTFEINFDNITGSIVAPFALSEFVPRNKG